MARCLQDALGVKVRQLYRFSRWHTDDTYTVSGELLCGLQVPNTHAETERLLAETKAIDVLEAELAAELDFGGISTSQVLP